MSSRLKIREVTRILFLGHATSEKLEHFVYSRVPLEHGFPLRTPDSTLIRSFKLRRRFYTETVLAAVDAPLEDERRRGLRGADGTHEQADRDERENRRHD